MELIRFRFINILKEVFHMLDMEEVMVSPLPAERSHWAVPKWHLEMLNCDTGQSSSEILMGDTFDTARLSPDLLMATNSFPWFEGREKAKDVLSMDLVVQTGCPTFPLSFKSEPLLGVAQTIAQLKGSFEAPGISMQAKLSVQLEENLSEVTEQSRASVIIGIYF